jgi:hypothetical protein
LTCTFDAFCSQFAVTETERRELEAILIAIRIRRLIEEREPVARILLRTIAAEAERTGSWEVPVDLQERIKLVIAGADE